MTSIFNPRITIAIPTFNRVYFLRQAIESALVQTYKNIEIIVSDNASTDASQQLLSSYQDKRLVIIEQAQNIGMVKNWNACLERATGDYFLLLSDDDALEPGAIEKLVEPFLSHSCSEAIGIVYGRTRIVDEQFHEITTYGGGMPYETGLDFSISFLRGWRGVLPCSILFRASDLKELGGFNSDKYFVACDAGAWMEIILRRGYVGYVSEIVSNYRMHHSNLTNATQIDSWISNSKALVNLVLDAIKDKNDQTYHRAKKVGVFHTASVIVALLYQSSQNKRFPLISFIKDVVTYRIYLLNWQGVFVICRTFVKFISPSLYYRLANIVKGFNV